MISGSNDRQRKFFESCSAAGITISAEQKEKLSAYAELLLEWNRKINLVSRRSTDDLFDAHLLHIIYLCRFLHFSPGASIADIGTGGGLPGIVLAIMFPSCSMTMMDSINKKITAVSSMIPQLGLANARAITGRAEELAKSKECMHHFDHVTSRAVAPLADLWKWSLPLLKKAPRREGSPWNHTKSPQTLEPQTPFVAERPSFVFYKGGDLSEEWKPLKKENRIFSAVEIPMRLEEISGGTLQDKKIILITPHNTKP